MHTACTSLFVSDASLPAIVLQLFPDPNSPWSITAGVKPPPPDPNKLWVNRTAISTAGMMQAKAQAGKTADVSNPVVSLAPPPSGYPTAHAHTKPTRVCRSLPTINDLT